MSIDELSPPVLFRGRECRASKGYFQGTHRCVPPEVTLERIRPHYRQAGLTRLADITGLDRIQISTIVAVRPNAASIVCSAGKGFTRAAAEASAAMEAIEVYHAEVVRLPVLEDSYQQLSARHRVIPLERLPLLRHSLFDVGRPELWALGWDMVAQEEVAVPHQLIPLYQSFNSLWRSRSFDPASSNGLASGNNFLEALCAGLYEVIERDALACSKLWQQHQGAAAAQGFSHSAPRRGAAGGDGVTVPSLRVDIDSVPGPLVQELVGRIRATDMDVYLTDRTVDTRVPVYEALVVDRTGRSFGIFGGYGAHLDTEIAMLRAITEALQGRAVAIAGARDDLFRSRRQAIQNGDGRAAVQQLDSIPSSPAVFRSSQATSSFEGDAHLLLERIRGVGHDQVVVFDLTQPGFDISVVKVIVPGFEGYMFEHYSPGPRARGYADPAGNDEHSLRP